MHSGDTSIEKIPVILVDKSAVECASIFDPTKWDGRSKAIVMSCWTECSVLEFCTQEISEICKNADHYCEDHFNNIRNQWIASQFDLEKVDVLAQVPQLHLRIESLFSSIKSLLDLIVQLIASEGIVSGDVHGFHRKKDVYGATVLNALNNNAKTAKIKIAENIRSILEEQKSDWIDETINTRDNLIHPSNGNHQIMFQFYLTSNDSELVLNEVKPPSIGEQYIDVYAREKFEKVKLFSMKFIKAIKNENNS